jgi:predicted amidohydrolase YtcJ
VKKIFTNIKVYDGDENNFSRKMLLVENNVYRFIDQNELKLIKKKDSLDLENLNGMYLYPAFIDSHLHLLETGMDKMRISLSDCSSKSKLIEIVFEISKNSTIVVLRGWDEDKLGFMPDRTFLDGITEKECMITRKCGHIGVCNSTFVKRLEINKIKEEDDSDFERGFLKERTLEAAINLMKYDKSDISQMLDVGSKELKKMGITSVHSDDYHSVELDVLLEVLKNQKEIRLFEKINPKTLDELNNMIESGVFDKDNQNNPYTKIKAVKVYLDGSFGGKTAALNAPYENSDNSGVIYMGSNEFSKYVALCEKNNLQLLVHVIGDQALDVALDAFSRNISSFNPLRHRLIHVQLATEEQLKKIKELNLYMSIQPIFYDKDIGMAKKILGEKRFEEMAYPFKKALELDIEFSLSTDAPVETINPFENLISATHFMDLKTAFEKYTISSAKASFDEKKLGKIKDGFYADGFLLKDNIFEMESEKLKHLKPLSIIYDGYLTRDIQH